MKSYTKKRIVAVLLSLGGVALTLTVWGAILGLPMVIFAIGLLIRAHEDEHGERPWWTKSFVTLYRERKQQDD